MVAIRLPVSLFLLESHLLWVVALLEGSCAHHLVFRALSQEEIVLLNLLWSLLCHVLTTHYALCEGSFICLGLVLMMLLEELVGLLLRGGALIEASGHHSEHMLAYTVLADT